jgi:hypothetical protein
MIHQHQGHGLVLLIEPAKKLQRNSSGLRPYDSVPLPVLASQVALYRPQNVRIVVNS